MPTRQPPKPKIRLLNPEPPNATLVSPDGTTRVVQPENSKDFKLEELYKLLDCELIEVTRSHAILQPYQNNRDYILIIDEEGKLFNKPLNPLATEWYDDNQGVDWIVGKALLCHTSMLE